jgi:UDP-glucuronate 4-epimerase
LIGREANKVMVDMQPGDVYRTAANIDAARALVGFEPATDLKTGLTHFVQWYRDYFTPE